MGECRAFTPGGLADLLVAYEYALRLVASPWRTPNSRVRVYWSKHANQWLVTTVNRSDGERL
jgi:hypothetical protein